MDNEEQAGGLGAQAGLTQPACDTAHAAGPDAALSTTHADKAAAKKKGGERKRTPPHFSRFPRHAESTAGCSAARSACATT